MSYLNRVLVTSLSFVAFLYNGFCPSPSLPQFHIYLGKVGHSGLWEREKKEEEEEKKMSGLAVLLSPSPERRETHGVNLNENKGRSV